MLYVSNNTLKHWKKLHNKGRCKKKEAFIGNAAYRRHLFEFTLYHILQFINNSEEMVVHFINHKYDLNEFDSDDENTIKFKDITLIDKLQFLYEDERYTIESSKSFEFQKLKNQLGTDFESAKKKWQKLSEIIHCLPKNN